MKNLYHRMPYKGISRQFCILQILVILLITFGGFRANAQSMGISSSAITPDASSIMELRTTTKGLLIPRLTTTERDAISSPATGLMVYNTTTSKFNFYNGSAWTVIFSGSAGVNSVTGTSNRITIGGTAADPTVDISSSYVGQTSLTTLGTISTGVWNGSALTSTYLPSATVYNNQANSFTVGSKQTFQNSSTTAGLNFAGISSDPSSLSNGDVWHNTTANTLKYRANGTTRTIANLDESQTLTNKDLSSGTNTFPTLNQNTTGSAGTLTTSRSIHGGSFNGSGDVTNIIASTYGGTGNGFAKFTGPASSEKTFTLPNASATILTSNAVVTIAQGGTNSTATPTSGGVGYGDGSAHQFTSAGTAGQVLQSNGSGAPTWVNGGTMILTGVSNNTAVNNTTLYFPISGILAGSATDLTAGTRSMVSRSGTVANLYVRLSAAIGSGKTGTVTVYKNGVATALAVTLAISGVTFIDNADAFTVVAGDELSVKVTTTGNVKFSWAADLTY